MNVELEKIIITKMGNKGEACVKYNLFSINKIMIDLTSTVNSISIAKLDNCAIVSGKMIEDLKVTIFELFQDDLADVENGTYQFENICELRASKL